MLKCEPEEDLSILYNNYSFYVNHTLNHLEELYNEYVKTKPIEKICYICNEKKQLYYENLNKERICTNCFIKTWSEYTMYKKFKPLLIELAKMQNKIVANQGYYYGAISTGVKVFKSYIAKREKRENEINKAKENLLITDGKLSALTFDLKKKKSEIHLEKSTSRGLFLNKELIEMEKEHEKLIKDLKQYKKQASKKHISFPLFKGNEIYFGKQRMFEFKKEGDGYYLYISDYRALRIKIRCKLNIGDLRKIHKVCKHEVIVKDNLLYCESCKTFVPREECKINHQEQFILKCIDKKEHEIVYPKMIINDKDYFFIFPTRDTSTIKTREEIRKWIKKEKDIEFCCLSFGIKKPVTLSIIQYGKIKKIQSFGNGLLYQKGETERLIRAKIFNGVAEKYKHEHPHKDENDKHLHWKKRNALSKVGKKIGFRHQRFCNYYNQKLSYDIIQYIKQNCIKPLIILRDTKGIKDISYKGELMKVLSRWSVQQQVSFIEYKSYLNNIPFYRIEYKILKSLKCWKCKEEDTNKLTTQILTFENEFTCQKCNVRYNLDVVNGFNLYQKMQEAI